MMLFIWKSFTKLIILPTQQKKFMIPLEIITILRLLWLRGFSDEGKHFVVKVKSFNYINDGWLCMLKLHYILPNVVFYI